MVLMFFISIIIAAAAVAADQLIKLTVVKQIALYESKDFIPKLLSLTHIRNSGAAWSIMEGKTWFLIGLPIIVIAFALWYMFKNRNGSKLALVSLALVLGGGIGNLIDRIRLGEVVDYLKLELFNFPIFNFADICVVVGAVLFCVYMIFFDESDKKDRKDKASKKEDGETDVGAL
jgi:signal peptidase II